MFKYVKVELWEGMHHSTRKTEIVLHNTTNSSKLLKQWSSLQCLHVRKRPWCTPLLTWSGSLQRHHPMSVSYGHCSPPRPVGPWRWKARSCVSSWRRGGEGSPEDPSWRSIVWRRPKSDGEFTIKKTAQFNMLSSSLSIELICLKYGTSPFGWCDQFCDPDLVWSSGLHPQSDILQLSQIWKNDSLLLVSGHQGITALATSYGPWTVASWSRPHVTATSRGGTRGPNAPRTGDHGRLPHATQWHAHTAAASLSEWARRLGISWGDSFVSLFFFDL